MRIYFSVLCIVQNRSLSHTKRLSRFRRVRCQHVRLNVMSEHGIGYKSPLIIHFAFENNDNLMRTFKGVRKTVWEGSMSLV